MDDPIYHEVRQASNGLKLHRLIQGKERGKWVAATEFASIGTRLYAAPENSVMPEVFEVVPIWANKIGG